MKQICCMTYSSENWRDKLEALTPEQKEEIRRINESFRKVAEKAAERLKERCLNLLSEAEENRKQEEGIKDDET